MKHSQKAIVLGIVALGFISLAPACALWNETLVTAKAVDDSDAGSSTAEASSAAGGGVSCGTDDWDTAIDKMTACGGGKGHCVGKNKVLHGESFTPCDKPDEACVPDEVINAGGKTLPTCKAIVGNGGGCINMDLIPEMKQKAGTLLKQENCPAGLTCAPCINPQAGNADTGMCGPVGVHKNDCTAGASDAAAAPAEPEVPCCTNEETGKPAGVCLAADVVPAGQKDDAPQDTCATGKVCAPASMVHNEAKGCDAGFIFGPGVCMDTCFSGMMKLASMIGILDQDVCGAGEVCIPCSKMPAGTPGCAAGTTASP